MTAKEYGFMIIGAKPLLLRLVEGLRVRKKGQGHPQMKGRKDQGKPEFFKSLGLTALISSAGASATTWTSSGTPGSSSTLGATPIPGTSSTGSIEGVFKEIFSLLD
ncbi:MAG: hypothetical protein Q7I97_08230 [Thermovirgaceae bacterium]|nr:hypothetical protein [Thermovirgaceae bacterium]